MSGRGRGRLYNPTNTNTQVAQAMPTLSSPTSSSPGSADIKDLFISERTPIEIYKILKGFIFAQPFNKTILRTCIEMLIKNMISNSTNAIEICKTLYVCSCYNDKTIGNEVWSQFFNILEQRFTELHKDLDRASELTLRSFTKFFIIAIHFMRNPSSSPKEDIVSAILILINKLNRTNAEDRHTYCQAVAWVSSYMRYIGSRSVLTQAFSETVDQLRDWIIEGTGGHWGLACLEAASNGGYLPQHSIKFYSRTLSHSQFVNLSECSRIILVPSRDKGSFNLPNLECINYID